MISFALYSGILSPDRGYLLSQEPSGGNVKALLGTLVANQTKIKSLEKQHKALKAACQSEKAEKADLIKDYKKAVYYYQYKTAPSPNKG